MLNIAKNITIGAGVIVIAGASAYFIVKPMLVKKCEPVLQENIKKYINGTITWDKFDLDAVAGNKNGNFSFYGGIIRGKLGIGTAYTKDKWKFLFDAYDLDKITLRARGQYKFYPNLYGIGQFILPEDRIGGGTYVGLSYTY